MAYVLCALSAVLNLFVRFVGRLGVLLLYLFVCLYSVCIIVYFYVFQPQLKSFLDIYSIYRHLRSFVY